MYRRDYTDTWIKMIHLTRLVIRTNRHWLKSFSLSIHLQRTAYPSQASARSAIKAQNEALGLQPHTQWLDLLTDSWAGPVECWYWPYLEPVVLTSPKLHIWGDLTLIIWVWQVGKCQKSELLIFQEVNYITLTSTSFVTESNEVFLHIADAKGRSVDMILNFHSLNLV